MDAEQAVRIAGTAFYIDSGPTHRSRVPVTCRRCGARTGLTLSAAGEQATISCPSGHETGDWRLDARAVRGVVAAAARDGHTVVPEHDEVQFRVPVNTDILPGYEDIL
ncbi:hypothetical protein ACIGHB_32940 [Streptomyces sp. NPDC085460]|uniref:hypothetical protein n=1 Tax=Streptomyces sp. NPDC085460 TaxID=3365723 RepID=UPI0037CF5E50